MRNALFTLAALSLSSTAAARDGMVEEGRDHRRFGDKTQVAYIDIDADTLAAVMDHEMGKSLDRRAWFEIDRAIEDGVEVMVVSKDEITDYYIDTAAKDLFLQAHADGTVHTFAWDGIHTGDELRLREFHKAGIRPLGIPDDEEAVWYIEASETDLDGLFGETFDGPPTYAIGAGSSLGDTCSDAFYMLPDECTKKTLARNCCNTEAARLEEECLKDKAKNKKGVLVAGAALVAGGGIATGAGGAGVPVVMAGVGLIAGGLVMDGAGECRIQRAANFATCETTAYIALGVDPNSECPS